MSDLLGPPTSHVDYQIHVRRLGPLLHHVPVDDRRDLLHCAFVRAIARWDPTRSPWYPWIVMLLAGEVNRYWRDRAPTHVPLPADLPDRDETSQIRAHLDHAMLLDQLSPSQRLAIMAHTGGGVAHRARLRLRQLIEKEVS